MDEEGGVEIKKLWQIENVKYFGRNTEMSQLISNQNS